MELMISEVLNFFKAVRGEVSQAELYMDDNENAVIRMKINGCQDDPLTVRLDHFFQSHEPLEARLSLALANKIVRLHDYTMRLVNKENDCFEFYLIFNKEIDSHG